MSRLLALLASVALLSTCGADGPPVAPSQSALRVFGKAASTEAACP